MKQTLVLLLLLVPTPASAQRAQPAAQPAPKPWWERITFFGDFRSRYDGIYLEDTATRHRQRFRLRVGLRTSLTEQIAFAVRLASGAPTDITSSNQTFTEFWSRKTINLDLASVTWAPKPVPGLTLGFGKYAYPVTRTQLVWDDDVNWEGTYQQYVKTFGKKGVLRLAAAQSPINETVGRDDPFLWAEQVQAGVSLGAHQLQLSVASYAFPDIDPLAVTIARRDLIAVNTNLTTTAPDGVVTGFLSDFHVVDVIGHATFATGSAEYPVQLVADVAVNTRAATSEDSAIWLVGTIGRAVAPRTAGASYTYARVEREALLSAFRFSEMPGTNIIGHMVAASYVPVNRVSIDGAVIFTQALEPSPGALNPWLTRLILDARISF